MALSSVTQRKATLNFLSHLYKFNKFNIENRRILSQCIRWNLLFSKIFSIIVFSTAVVCTCVPLAIALIMGRMEPIFPVHIMFVPTNTLWGYAIHCVFFISVIVTAYCGTVANDVFLLTSTMHIWPMHKIMDHAVIGLNQATGSTREAAIINSTWLHRRVRNIVLMHKEIYL